MLFKLKICLKDRKNLNTDKTNHFRLSLIICLVNSLLVLLILGKGGEQGRFTTLSLGQQYNIFFQIMNLLPPHIVRDLKKLQKKEKVFLTFVKTSLLLGIIFLVLSFAPSIWYSLGAKVDDFSKAILFTATSQNEKDIFEPAIVVPDWQPPIDPKLSRDTTLKISKIGVDTVIHEATIENYEEALKVGTWRIPDFGTPVDRSKPVIIAAHRFGYLAWTNIYRRKNSFYNLPKLKIGDLVEINYKQRKFIYEIYGEGRGEEIEDYTANLILYTCETLNSSIRIFKYARLLHI